MPPESSHCDAGPQSWTVPSSSAQTRLDVFLAACLEAQGLSRGKVQKMIRAGKVLVDNTPWTKPKDKLLGGEVVCAEVEIPPSELVAEAMDLDVVFENERLAVVNKPAGLTVHPASGLKSGTLVHGLLERWPRMRAMDGERPGIVHRIDKDTTGLLVVALDEGARLAMSQAFAQREVDKEYLALVFGRPKSVTGDHGEIDAPIGRHPRSKTKMAVVEKGGREARSLWRRLWTCPDGSVSLVAVRIETGRTHQIRVHMAHLGHPLLGDKVYGARENAEWARDSGYDPALAGRQMLHAWKVGFDSPLDGERVELCVPPPLDFQTLALSLSHTVQRVGLTGLPGCGKSTLGAALSRAGVPVFSADDCVEKLYEHGADGWDLLRSRFGDEISPPRQAVDKATLFEMMCQSEAARREVLDVVHPLVRHRAQEFFRQHVQAPVAVAEVPLLLEGGWDSDQLVELVIGVDCPDDARRQRLSQGRGWPEQTIAMLESWQWSGADKLARCQLVVSNAGSRDDLEAEADRVLETLATLRRERDTATQAQLQALWTPAAGE